MPLTVLQHGWFGTRNYGDERSAWAVRQLVREVEPDAKFIVLGANQQFLERYHQDADIVETRQDATKVRELAHKADVIIYGPGTVIGNEPVHMTKELLETGVPIIVWGAGAWHAIDPDGVTATVLRTAVGVSVRDLYAFGVANAVMHAHGCRLPVIVADPMVIDAVQNPQASKHGVCVSWHLARAVSGELQNIVLEHIANAMVEIGGKWFGIPASWPLGEPLGASPFDNDAWMHDRLFQMVGERVKFHRPIPEGFEGVKTWLGQFDIIITSRLHMGIPGLAGGRRAVYFGQEKCERMAQTLGVPGIYAGGYNQLTAASIVKAAQADCQPSFPSEPTGVGVMRSFLERAVDSLAPDLDWEQPEDESK